MSRVVLREPARSNDTPLRSRSNLGAEAVAEHAGYAADAPSGTVGQDLTTQHW